MKTSDNEISFAYSTATQDRTYKGQPKPDNKGFFKPGSPEDRAAFAQAWDQQKLMWAFNQWFNTQGQNLRVKTHFELIDGAH
jgi:hypothetical protein